MSSFKHYLLILAISLLPFFFILSTHDLPHTHDGGVHLPRIAAYVKALSDGHLPVRWAGDLNYGYGLPLFNFIYQTPYFLASLFVYLGMGLVASFKAILVISFVFSGFFMYAFALAFFGDKNKALLVAVFYQFAPFRLVEIFLRGSIGSLYAYTFLPLVLLGLTLIMKKASPKHISLTAIATALLIVSHNSLSLVFFGICVLYVAVFSSRKMFIASLGALVLGLTLSAFYWIPAVFEHKYTYGDLYMKDVFRSHFPPFTHFFIPNPTNDIRLRTEEIPVQFGLFHTTAIILACYFLWKKRIKDLKTQKLVWFCILTTLFSLFFMSPMSSIVWQHSKFLRQFQFPWRLLAIPTFTTSLLAISYFSISIFKKRALLGILLTATIVSTIVYWYPQQGFDRNIREQDYWDYPLNTTYFGETDLIWSAGPAKKFPKNRIETIAGQAQVVNFVTKTQAHSFTVLAESESTLVDHTQYYPGWRVYVNNVKVPIQFQDANWRGLIVFTVPAGTHTVRVTFGENKTRAIADTISMGTLVGLIGLILWGKRKYFYHFS